jgi:hypothetical protein
VNLRRLVLAVVRAGGQQPLWSYPDRIDWGRSPRSPTNRRAAFRLLNTATSLGAHDTPSEVSCYGDSSLICSASPLHSAGSTGHGDADALAVATPAATATRRRGVSSGARGGCVPTLSVALAPPLSTCRRMFGCSGRSPDVAARVDSSARRGVTPAAAAEGTGRGS